MLSEELPSDRASIVYLDDRGKSLFEIVWPQPAGSVEDVAKDIVRQAIEEQRPLLASRQLRFSETGAQKSALAEVSLLCLPLGSLEGPRGAICLCRDGELEPYSCQDLEFLVFLSPALQRAVAGSGETDPSDRSDSAEGKAVDPIIGTSPASASIRELIERFKDLSSPVFIYGESGTGKDVVARAIHERGARRTGPFIAVNCVAIPELLLESELFGHSRGSFTGALRDKLGLIEAADRGTFFLDEIGDLPLPLQAKLLRLLEEREIRRIGETRTRRVDVRFISATNKNLEKEIEQGKFRLDLYYRLRILTIEIPPLRERKEDLLLLINHFVSRYAKEMGKDRIYVTPQTTELLISYSWPGNIRELQNEIQRALVLAGEENLLRPEHLSSKLNPGAETSSPRSYSYFQAKAEFEKRFLRQALDRFGHNKARTAAEIGLTRQGLFKLLKKYELGNKKGRLSG